MLKNMFTEKKIGSITVKNRFVNPAMISNYCDEDGSITDRFKDFYERKAQGGYGMIVVESFGISQEGAGFKNGPRIDDDRYIADLLTLTDRIHKYDAKAFLQLSHCGAQMSSSLSGMPIVSASCVPASGAGEIPKEMTIEDIQKVISDHCNGALRAKKANFDGVEVHLAHGYLLNEFVSLYANKRTDQYGGNMSNRLRIVKEILDGIFDLCGKDFPVSVRISLMEGVDSGHSLADVRAMAILLEQYGASVLSLSCGNHRYGTTITNHFVDHGWLAEYAGTVSKVVNIPTIIAGRITDPVVAEGIVAAGLADFVAMARASLADPDMPNKAAKGDLESIRQCIGCMQGCYDHLKAGTPICCLVNPTLGYEYKKEQKMAEKPKRVLVAGGGPGGIQAAITSAQCGHTVDIFYPEEMAGGNFAVAAYPPGKGEVSTFLSWGRSQMEKCGVTIHNRAKVTLDTIREYKPDHLIVATGATPNKFPIPGIHLEHVLMANDVLTGKSVTGQKVVVAGGGLVGLETALYLAQFGRTVTVLEALPVLAKDMGSTRPTMMKLLSDYNVALHTDSKIARFTEEGTFVIHDEVETFYPCDSVVLALGFKGDKSLADEAKGLVAGIQVIGDAAGARKALDAIREGFLAGINI